MAEGEEGMGEVALNHVLLEGRGEKRVSEYEGS